MQGHRHRRRSRWVPGDHHLDGGPGPVGIADSWAVHAHLGGPLQLGAVLAGHLGGFGLLWVAQFVILDRVLFTGSHNGAGAPRTAPATALRTN